MFPDPTPTPFIDPATIDKGLAGIKTGFDLGFDYLPIVVLIVVVILYLFKRGIRNFIRFVFSYFRGDY